MEEALLHFYVYVYLDPRKPGKFKYGEYEFDYEPFYVGKGEGDRYKTHLTESSLKSKDNPFKNNVIKKIIKETGNIPKIIKYRINITELEAFELETKMIKVIGRRNIRTGPLTNLTDGGEGCSGRIITDETKEKLSISNKETWKKLPEELKRIKIEKIQKTVIEQYANMSNEEKSRRKKLQKEGIDNISKEDKLRWLENCKKTYTLERRKQISDLNKIYGAWVNGKNPQVLNPRRGTKIGNHLYIYAVYDLSGKLIEKSFSPLDLAEKYKVDLVTMVKFARNMEIKNVNGCYKGYYWIRFLKENINNIVDQITDIFILEKMKKYKPRNN